MTFKKQTILVLGVLLVLLPFLSGTAVAKSKGYVNTNTNINSKHYPGEGFMDYNIPGAVQKAWKSTVQVRISLIHARGRAEKRPLIGAGIILDLDEDKQEALIVTANHFRHGLKNRKYKFEVRWGHKNESGKEKFYTARKTSIVMTKANKDLIYLRVKYPHKVQPAAAPLKVIDNEQVLPENLITIGFPFLRLRQMKSWNTPVPKNYKKLTKRFSRGNLIGKGLSRNKVYILAHNADMLQGNSGGPLVDREGNVVGINLGMYHLNSKENSGTSNSVYSQGTADRFYYAISVSEVVEDIEHIKNNKLW